MNLICENQKIMLELKKEKDRILDFFEIEVKDNIYIKELNFNEFKREFETYLDTQLNDYVTGFIEDDKNLIICLKYEDWDKTIHKDELYEEYIKVVIHEFVHMIHSKYCNKFYPSDEIYEGVAYYLANQSNNDYYDKFKELISNKSHKEILDILKGVDPNE